MKHRTLLILASAAALGCSSQGNPSYKITLKDGREFMTATRPEYDEKIGYYRFRGMNHKQALIRADEVLMLNEL